MKTAMRVSESPQCGIIRRSSGVLALHDFIGMAFRISTPQCISPVPIGVVSQEPHS
jgi:hypothetical protein